MVPAAQAVAVGGEGGPGGLEGALGGLGLQGDGSNCLTGVDEGPAMVSKRCAWGGGGAQW